ncbi:MAG: thioredoxin domain-containing protein [Chloroflexota bacterium]
MKKKNQQGIIVGGIIAAVVVVFIGVLFLARPNVTSFDYEGIPADRTEDGAFILGDPSAPITIVAWEDFLCSHCQDYQPELKRFFEEYVETGQARFEFRMLPISNQSQFVFQLVECAAIVQDDPAAFWLAHDTMFAMTTTGTFDGADFAREIGVPYSELLDCTEEANQWQADQAASNVGALAGQITGTPAVGWRLNGGPVRLDIISRRPNTQQIGELITLFSSQTINQ